MKELFSISVSLFLLFIFIIVLTFSNMAGYILFIVFIVVGVIYLSNIFFNVRMPDAIVNVYHKIGVKLKKISPDEKPNAKPLQDLYDKLMGTKKTPTTKETPLTSDSLMPSDKKDAKEDKKDTKSKKETKANKKEAKANKKAASTDQAFHVNGDFDYTMARAVCRSYGATLATYDQISNAHKKGAEWCDYGWSEDGMVLFPTQRASWAKYQESEVPQKCGIPGINGGYNTDLTQHLGANCYGKKPPGEVPPFAYPPKKLSQTPDYEVSPFNYTKWNI